MNYTDIASGVISAGVGFASSYLFLRLRFLKVEQGLQDQIQQNIKIREMEQEALTRGLKAANEALSNAKEMQGLSQRTIKALAEVVKDLQQQLNEKKNEC